ncbi:unnamed protein product, partial [Scytosiphon promiscuus]
IWGRASRCHKCPPVGGRRPRRKIHNTAAEATVLRSSAPRKDSRGGDEETREGLKPRVGQGGEHIADPLLATASC